MKDLPIALKVMINIILYVVYVLFVSVIFSFIFPVIMQFLGKEILNPAFPENKDLFDKIQIFIAILVLLISLILRKYFYISSRSREVETVSIKTESYTAKKKQEVTKKTSTKNTKKTEPKKESDEDIKIYVEKEIK